MQNFNYPSSINNWLPNQLVLSSQMIQFSYDIYNKIAGITDNITPCIVSGCQVTTMPTTTSATFTGGLLRTNDITEPYLPTSPIPGFFQVEQTTLNWTVGQSGLIVGQITITPNISGNPLYIFSGDILFLLNGTGYDPTTMVILGSVNGAYGYYPSGLTYNARDYDLYSLANIAKQHNISLQSNNNYQMSNTDYNISIVSIFPAVATPTINLPLITGTNFVTSGLNRTKYSIYNSQALASTPQAIQVNSLSAGTSVPYGNILLPGALGVYYFEPNSGVWLVE